MTNWMIRYDLRTADGIGAPHAKLYAAALEQAAWADERGCPGVLLPEHHGSRGGYLSSPLMLGAGIAARTSQTRILLTNILLRDPFAIAEDLACLDLISGSRVDAVLTVGYVPSEFDMYGEDFTERVQIFEDKFTALRRLLAGEQVLYQGRIGAISPIPVTPLTLRIGGATPAAARRAARFGDAFMPMVPNPELIELYQAECTRRGRKPVAYPLRVESLSVLVVDDPDRAWATIGPYLLSDMNTYGHWKAAEPGASPYYPADDIQTARDSGLYAVVTPDQCVELANRIPSPSSFFLHPLIGGLDPDIGWQSLELFADKVLPHLVD